MVETWHHNVPSFGQVKVASGTSPTSWYTPGDDVQHIAYVGEDSEIHEMFFRFRNGDGKWHHNVPSFGEVRAASGTSPTSWYTPSDDVQHIAYVGEDLHIHEMFFRFRGGDNRWHHGVPTFDFPTKAASGTSPTSWYTPSDDVQHVAYVGQDLHIHEAFFRFRGGDGKWHHGVPTFDFPTKAASGTSPTSWYTLGDSVQHIAYVGTDQQINEAHFRLRQMPEISLRYVGFHCFGETGELSASDEPYFTFGVVPAVLEKRNILQSQPRENVDGGESHGDLIELYRGLPLGAVLSITLVEHDEGNPDKYREHVGVAVRQAADATAQVLALIPAVGTALSTIATALTFITVPALTDAVNGILGTEDDPIGSATIVLTPGEMIRLLNMGRQNFEGIQAHFETPLISGDGASYKAYFDAVEIR